jgi:hypothetical protein
MNFHVAALPNDGMALESREALKVWRRMPHHKNHNLQVAKALIS